MIQKILLGLLSVTSALYAQSVTTSNEYPFFPTYQSVHRIREYSFNIYDGCLSSYTMRQFNQNFVETNRLVMRRLDEVLGYSPKNGQFSTWIKISIPFILTIPLTHEEGHRSILTNRNIGSISQPFSNSDGTCYVKGVTNTTLQNLRDTDLPAFIRLHTAGIESDYIISSRENELISFKQDDFQNVGFDLLWRNFGNILYLFDGLKTSINNQLGVGNDVIIEEEETNELDRDIVGHDVYGMIYHLYRPDEIYTRYKTYNDLLPDERSFANRVGWRSMVNILNTIYFTGRPFQLSDEVYLSGNMGYCIAPFGDFIDEKIYLKYRKFNIAVYARQAENRNTWFQGYGISLVDYEVFKWLSFTGRGHFWFQPEGLDFNTSKAVPGGAVEFTLKGFLPNETESNIKTLGLSIGCMYKTTGFMPEIENHDKSFSMNVGVILRQ